MGKKVLGNDPFLHGAAPREPAEAPKAPASAAQRPPAKAAARSTDPDAAGAPAKPTAPAGGDRPPVRTEGAPAPGDPGAPEQRVTEAPASAAPGDGAGPAKERTRKRVARSAAPTEEQRALLDRPLPPPKKLPREPQGEEAPASGPGEAATAEARAPARRPVRPGPKTKKASGKRQPLARSPFDLPPPDAPANVAVAVPAGLDPRDEETPRRSPARQELDAGDFSGDGGLLPADLAAAPPAPRVVAVAPVPEARPPAPVRFVAPLESRPPSGIDALRGLVAIARRLSRLDSGLPSLDVDEFGRDAPFEARVRPLLSWMYRRYFRVDELGFDKLPRTGPVILVANRAGPIPWDAAMVGIAAARHGREVRPLLEDAVFHFPFLGLLVNRLGAVRACPENAERLLSRGGAVAVFPEGAGGCAKPFRDRYRVQRFGRGGFVRLALRTGARIVPAAVVGSEEAYPILGRVPAGPLGVPFLPITPTWPWLGAAGLWPLPSKWTIELGEPVDLSGLGPADAGDDAKMMRIAERVRTTVQEMLEARLADRAGVFSDSRQR